MEEDEDEDVNEAFVKACLDLKFDKVRDLVESKNADINYKSATGGVTGLMKALVEVLEDDETLDKGQKLVGYLLERGADLTVVNDDGWNALMIACRSCGL